MANITEVIGKNFALKNTTKRINGAPVTIKTYLDVDTFGSIVQTVAQSSFTDGEYHAENREIARRYCIIKYMTDIEISDTDIAEIFKTTQGGNNWYGAIESEVIKCPVWAEVELAIDNQIAYLLSKQTAFDKLCTDLSAIIEVDNEQNLADIKEVLDGLNKVNEKDFVKAITENVIEKTGGEPNGEKSEGATE
jgi:hypothetical protein